MDPITVTVVSNALGFAIRACAGAGKVGEKQLKQVQDHLVALEGPLKALGERAAIGGGRDALSVALSAFREAEALAKACEEARKESYWFYQGGPDAAEFERVFSAVCHAGQALQLKVAVDQEAQIRAMRAEAERDAKAAIEEARARAQKQEARAAVQQELIEVLAAKLDRALELRAAPVAPAAAPSAAGPSFVGVPSVSWSEIVVNKAKDKLGEGGFGEVYRGTYAGARVAVKVINAPDMATLERELRATVRVNHAHVVRVLGVITKEKPFAVLQEFAPGGTLRDALNRIPQRVAGEPRGLPLADAVEVLAQVAGAMAHVHKQGIKHGDLKPANILVQVDGSGGLNPWDVRVTDFGLAKAKAEGGTTKTMSVQGTPVYMAPELLDEDEMSDRRVDVYAYGIVAYEVLTGHEPFTGVSAMKLMRNVGAGKRPEAGFPPAGTPQELVDLVNKCWHQDPDARPTFGEIFAALSGPIAQAVEAGAGQEAPTEAHTVDPNAAINADVDEDGNAALHRAAEEGNTAEVRRILAIPGVDVNLKGKWEGTPLLWASNKGHVEVVKVLLAAPGIDVNKADKDGQTPLYLASKEGHTEVVKLLLAVPGIDVNRAHKDGETPLVVACKLGKSEVVKVLLAAPGIDVNRADKYGNTPLHWASVQGRTEVVKVLLAAPGINVNGAEKGGRTPLYAASWKGHSEVVKLLLGAPGVDVNQADLDGNTPLTKAKNDKIRVLLRAAGATE